MSDPGHMVVLWENKRVRIFARRSTSNTMYQCARCKSQPGGTVLTDEMGLEYLREHVIVRTFATLGNVVSQHERRLCGDCARKLVHIQRQTVTHRHAWFNNGVEL